MRKAAADCSHPLPSLPQGPYTIKKNRIDHPRLPDQSDSKTTGRISDEHQDFSFFAIFFDISLLLAPEHTQHPRISYVHNLRTSFRF
jgi:hypothetical protein